VKVFEANVVIKRKQYEEIESLITQNEK